MSEPVIEVRHLSKSFGTHVVLRDVDFTVNAGDVTCIIGASGSGKSTLLRCINLLERPTSGKVRVDGEDITDAKGKELADVRAGITARRLRGTVPTDGRGNASHRKGKAPLHDAAVMAALLCSCPQGGGQSREERKVKKRSQGREKSLSYLSDEVG